MKDLRLRIGRTKDLQELQRLFMETVNSVCKKDYNNEQIKAWVSSAKNTTRWEKILSEQFVLIATLKTAMVGFATLDRYYIDLFYVHKDFQRRGIGEALYNRIELEAMQRNQSLLIADVSITAKSFFGFLGFKVKGEQKIYRRGVELINFRMEKQLSENNKETSLL